MSSSRYSDAFCGAGAGSDGKTGKALLQHFREFVLKVWKSESRPGQVLVLYPEVSKTATGCCVKTRGAIEEGPGPDGKAVFFFTAAQLECFEPTACEHFRSQYRRDRELHAVLLSKMDGGGKFLEVEKELRKATLLKWFALQQIHDECVVCYEETGPSKKAQLCATCAANVCVQCTIDIALDANHKHVGRERVVRCPMCAVEYKASFPRICAGVLVDKSLSKAHKEFASFWKYFECGDLLKALRCDFTKMTAKMRDAIELDFEVHRREDLMLLKNEMWKARPKMERQMMSCHLKSCSAQLRRALRECDAAKVKTEAKSASDDSLAAASGSAVPNRVRSDRCARCEKVFWDKKEKKRAPKCPKCKRVAYCSGVCRKKHRAAHKLQCEAGAKAKKKKKAAAKAAKLHGR